jgi:3-deoxy-manno-octulosonate cytidylyltransferase (CMP-KDO synthetase)
MQMLGDKTVIHRTYQNTLATGLFDEVLVATDSEIIFREIDRHGGNVCMSKGIHESGSDRIAEAIEHKDVELVVNVQGDEPFMQREPLAALIGAFRDPSVQVASLKQRISEEEDVRNPNVVKVVTNLLGDALYFSRSVIPYRRDQGIAHPFFRHIGVYGFRKKALMAFTQWPHSQLELTEKLEQLRYLDNGVPIRMVETAFNGMGIDTPEDLEKARQLLH